MYTDKNTFSDELAAATKIAYQAGQIMLQYFDVDQQKVTKLDGSLVTVADTTINRLVIDELALVFPDDGIIGEEESNTDYGIGRKWFCDPVDGTNAYTWGVPTAMFSLGLCIDGVPMVGVAYDPFLDRLYSAVAGYGAFCNNQSLSVSNLGLDKGIVGITSRLSSLRRPSKYHDYLVDNNVSTAGFSGAVYKGALIARGRMSGMAEINLNPQDVAAVDVIVHEAGGRLTDLSGNRLDYSRPFRGAIIANRACHEELMHAYSQE